MEEKEKFLGCFASGPAVLYEADQATKDMATEKGKLFRSYLWGKMGISDRLKKLKSDTYGKDLMIILFQFYINPLPLELQNLTEIEPYRKKEKAIGVPIIVTDENFFNKSEEGRHRFLKQSILQKLGLLAELVKRKKLDTKIEELRNDVEKILN
ncbi:hypothetical protein GS399_05235 [Pedobacter sp. HMF7647]|uniref:Uncharacterized protein n=1 Tax=Hufsiella arboris TaxID=2695275 RepID=A0A7K1Y8J8_9SPHI|nr:hypothetical protein [Hufsiella arboris]MXV50368.1 hypothetical protein [Hufsiella arboris]